VWEDEGEEREGNAWWRRRAGNGGNPRVPAMAFEMLLTELQPNVDCHILLTATEM